MPRVFEITVGDYMLEQTPELALGSFACEFGDLQRAPESIAGHAELCVAKGIGLSLSAMGCRTFWQMTQPLATYVTRCVGRTLAASKVALEQVNYIVFATTDQNLPFLDRNFTRDILAELGLVNCVPVFISLQQCASSLAALSHARGLLANPRVNNVILAAFDFVAEDKDRIMPFALFGDAVASCLLSRDQASEFALLSYAVSLDFEGLLGRDSFDSRKRVAAATLATAFESSSTRAEELEKCFSTNIYKPLAMFGVASWGIPRAKLYIETLPERAHCGNCDWMLNLIHYVEHNGVPRGKTCLVQASAPAFFSCAVIRGAADAA